MDPAQKRRKLADAVREFVRAEFTPHFGELAHTFDSHPTWRRVRELGTELWLDTGSLEDAGELWTREFAALTTNNTLLNKEVQRGIYDDLIREAANLLRPYGLSQQELVLEVAFVLNARHGLRLVETFDARVSVEEHTDLAHDVDRAVAVARRYHAICPERFIVKIPLTPAGLLATRRLAREGVAVNHTLGFSARQNYLVARLAQPAYVNVFLGRLGSFVADNRLGEGSYVGEKATLASQAAVRTLRRDRQSPSRQIGASLRQGTQVRDLLGLDVMTMPPRVARDFLQLAPDDHELVDHTSMAYQPALDEDTDPQAAGLDTLWDVGPDLVACADALEQEDLEAFSPADLVGFLHDRGCGDVLPRWSEEQLATSAEEGKIPQLANWRDALAEKTVGLDSLMNLAGLNAFAADQRAMDERVAGVLAGR
ncbi:MAG: transaldolase family protein [Candidatus Brocadiia bacterium]